MHGIKTGNDIHGKKAIQIIGKEGIRPDENQK